MTQPEAEEYWKAAIATLPTEEKRIAAWSFYSKWFSDNDAGGLFSGIILLLEAHHTMLLALPDSFNKSILVPLGETADILTERLSALKDFETRTFAAMHTAAEASQRTAQVCLSAASDMEKTIASSFQNMDLRVLTQRISADLEGNTIVPFQNAIDTLSKETTVLGNATQAAKEAIVNWRRVHLASITLAIACVSLAFFGGLFLFGWNRLVRFHENKFARAIAEQNRTLNSDQETLRQLSTLGIEITLKQAADDSGEPWPGMHALIVDDPVNAVVRSASGKSKGMIFFRTRRHPAEILRIKEMETPGKQTP